MPAIAETARHGINDSEAVIFENSPHMAHGEAVFNVEHAVELRESHG